MRKMLPKFPALLMERAGAYGESGGKAEREGEGNFMEGGKEVRLSLAGRRPVNHHADHVYV